jgi:hypothetical protein
MLNKPRIMIEENSCITVEEKIHEDKKNCEDTVEWKGVDTEAVSINYEASRKEMIYQTGNGIFQETEEAQAAQEICKISLENSRPGIVIDPIDLSSSLKDIGCSNIVQEEELPSFVHSFSYSSSLQAEVDTDIDSDFEVARTEEAQNETGKQSETVSCDESYRCLTSMQAGVDTEIGSRFESEDDEESWEEKGEGETCWHKAFSSSLDRDNNDDNEDKETHTLGMYVYLYTFVYIHIYIYTCNYIHVYIWRIRV